MITHSWRRWLAPTVAVAALAVVAGGCSANDAALPSPSGQPGNPTDLPPLPAGAGSGPFLPVYENSVVSASNTTAVSLQPTLNSGSTLTGQFTFSLAPLTPDPNVTWTSWSTGTPAWRLPAGAGLVDGGAYQWKAVAPDKSTIGPYSMTVDLSATNQQDGDNSSAVGVSLATGMAHFTWASHSMESASGPISVGLDYSPTNSGQPGVPGTGWRIVTASASGWDQLRVNSAGAVSIHAKNNSWATYVPAGNGYYQPVYSAYGQSAATGMFGTLVKNTDGSYTLTDTTKTVSTFAAPNANGVGYLETVSISGQQAVTQTYDGTSGRITGITDPVSGRTVAVDYGGSSNCPSYSGFVAAGDGLICQVRFWDGSTSAFGYVSTPAGPQLGRLVDYANSSDAPSVTDLAYDGAGRLVAVRSPLVAAAAVSPAAQSVTGTNPADPQLLTVVTYDNAGRVATITNPAPAQGADRVQMTYVYENNTTTTTVGPNGSASSITYDPNSLRSTSRTTDNVTTTVQYDAQGNPTQATDAVGGVTTYTYDASGVLTNKTGPGGAATTYAYDRTYATKNADDPGTPMQGLDVQYWGNTTWSGMPSTEQLGPLPAPGAALPNDLGLTWTTSPVPGVGQWSARLVGTLTLPPPATAGTNDTYRFSVNGSGPPQVWIDQIKCGESGGQNSCAEGIQLAGGEHSIRIDLTSTSAQGQLQLLYGRNTTNLQPLPMSMLSPGYHVTVYQGSADALSAGSATTMANWTAYSQPQIGQTSAMWNNAGLTTQTLYESTSDTGTQPVGQQSSVTNTARAVGTVLPAGNQTAIGYWGATDKESSGCSDQSAQVQGGLPKTFSLPNATDGSGTGTTTTTWFNADGSVAAAQTAGAAQLCLYYDDAMRLSRSSMSGNGQSSQAEYDYAVNGNPLVAARTSAVQGPGESSPQTLTTTTTLDLLGRVITVTDGWGTTETTSYDSLGKVTSVATRAANGYTTTKSFTYTAGNPTHTEVSDSFSGGQPLVSADATYDQGGRITGVTYSNGTSGAGVYGPNELPSSWTWTDAGGQKWSSANTYSPAGRILTTSVGLNDQTSTFSYTYDTASRLSQATLATSLPVPQTSWAYTYDANSNRTSRTVNGNQTTTYAYNRADQLTGVTGDPALSGQVGYDAVGNVTTIGPLTITYDVTGNATSIADRTANATVAFQRDATATVVATTKQTPSGSTTLKYSLGGLLLNGSNAPVGQQIGLPGGVTVQRQITGAPSASASASAASVSASASAPAASPAAQTWLYPDLNGNTFFDGDATGTARDTAPVLYDPFGAALGTIPAAPVDGAPLHGWQATSGYETQQLSVPVNLLGQRLYLPSLGRFLQVDPRAGGSANSYDFANQDPINGSDLSGAKAWWKWMTAILVSVVLAVATAGAAAAVAGAAAAIPALAAVSTAAATAVGVVAGAVIGAAGSIAVYAAQTAIMGNPWSWTSFAEAGVLGALGGAYAGFAGINNVGKAVVAGSLSAARKEGEIGALNAVRWWSAGGVKEVISRFVQAPLTRPAALVQDAAMGRSSFDALSAFSKATSLTVCVATLSTAAQSAISSVGSAGADTSIGRYSMAFSAGGYVTSALVPAEKLCES